ncbi:tumor necrosis factor receptor superfamily member 25 isoform X4 [Trichechus manatus latirostris]|uniref:Tumor necrosis factor receptor superfamily member 25 isoform X4 n=1 Tax=Trichechus manatus latirostris TaxID=127582 RepID=A0A2Y9E137_TRIMA|nr:tumor necrosis factor receptor superfamily member 25 isoform X4 [Trichechus manatus latirostris]
MEPQPRGCAAVVVALLLVLLGAQGQGSTPSPRCDCARDSQKRNGLFCCRGCPEDEAGKEAVSPLQATHLSSPGSTHTLLAPPGSSEKVCTVQLVGNSWTPGAPQTQEAPCPEVPWSWDQLPSRALGPPMAPALPAAPPAGSAATALQPGPQLYDVMDAVPARRWKEFMRTLGLREAEIEAVEVEVGRFRDQQYEMLKRWRQQQPAGLGAVYSALERMGLQGCAEDLRSRLQRGP